LSAAEDELALQLKAAGIEFEREVKFHPKRKWRFDFVLGDGLAVEVEGGLYVQGRHSRGAGMEKDLEKYQEAMKLGWNVYRVSPRMIKQGAALETISILMGEQIRRNPHGRCQKVRPKFSHGVCAD